MVVVAFVKCDDAEETVRILSQRPLPEDAKGITRQSVSTIVERFKETGSVYDRHHSGLVLVVEADDDFLNSVIWTNEALFKLSSYINRHNCVY